MTRSSVLVVGGEGGVDLQIKEEKGIIWFSAGLQSVSKGAENLAVFSVPHWASFLTPP